ncbi:MAG: hypothetical protein A4E69_00407 [Syntrophus sp. PtaB.Bin138]|jgi:hypothetical protein|nr:MAG: hypothetical protein A4E69_00407 [Syntrophus sp. PtaB.Bin138]
MEIKFMLDNEMGREQVSAILDETIYFYAE